MLLTDLLQGAMQGNKVVRPALFSSKIILVMKLTAILLLAAFLQVSARGYSQRLSISEKNALLETVFKKIEKQTGYTFWYDYAMLKEAKRVNIEASDITLPEALELCFKGQSLSYTIVNKTIVVKLKEIVQAQDAPPVTVKGTVKDARNQPLAGVTVTLKGRAGAATTDEDGNFSVNVPENVKSLEFSSVGYNTKEVAITGTTVLVTLEEKISGLQQVVVVGYGTQQRSNITGAVATVSSKSIENQSLASFDRAIAGQVAGVNVAQRIGTPGGGVSIRVRGSGSISAGNEPLYVIDGIPVEGGFNRDANPLAALNPNDIESIQILKDASSAAIYGSRGSNGVVIVTTKRGKFGKTKVQFDAYYGMQEVAKKIDLLNAQEYAEYSTGARNNGWVDQGGKVTDPNSVRPARYQIPTMFQNPSSLGKGTDWQDQIFRKAPMQNYQVTTSGGSDQSQFLFSAAYFNQEGVVINSGFKRYSFRVNLDTKISDRIKLGVTLAPSYSTNKIVFADDQVFAGGVIASALAMPPTTPVYNPDGTFTTQLGAAQFIGDIENPVALATLNKNDRTNFRALGTLFAEISIYKGLKFKTSIGGDYNNSKQAIFHPSDVGRNGVRAPVIPDGSANGFEGLTWLNENLLTYDRIINNDHNISALAGYTA